MPLQATLMTSADEVHTVHFSDDIEPRQEYGHTRNDRSTFPKPSAEEPQLETVVPGETTYYSANDLTTQPKSLGELVFDRPGFSDSVSGQMTLKLWISSRGDVIEVSIERSDLPDGFSAAVADAFQRLRFEPGELNGVPVGALINVEVSYGSVLNRVTP